MSEVSVSDGKFGLDREIALKLQQKAQSQPNREVEALEWITKVIVADPPLSMNRRK
jgi:hypothetical protein